MVFDATPFYPEGGGQVGDVGFFEDSQGNQIEILDTKKENNVIIHFTKKLPIAVRDTFTAIVHKKTRENTTCNHTATHLLHEALREVLGVHVAQKGSAVNANYLAF